jgi:hypothetical protein
VVKGCCAVHACVFRSPLLPRAGFHVLLNSAKQVPVRRCIRPQVSFGAKWLRCNSCTHLAYWTLYSTCSIRFRSDLDMPVVGVCVSEARLHVYNS